MNDGVMRILPWRLLTALAQLLLAYYQLKVNADRSLLRGGGGGGGGGGRGGLCCGFVLVQHTSRSRNRSTSRTLHHRCPRYTATTTDTSITMSSTNGDPTRRKRRHTWNTTTTTSTSSSLGGDLVVQSDIQPNSLAPTVTPSHPPQSNVVSMRGKPPKSLSRPGHNSYLQIMLDEAMLRELYNVVSGEVRNSNLHDDDDVVGKDRKRQDYEVLSWTDQSQFESSINLNTPPTTSPRQPSGDYSHHKATEPQTMATYQDRQGTFNKRKPFRIRMRSLKSLHMTFFFGGEVLANHLSADELQSWHALVTERLDQAGFHHAVVEGGSPPLTTEETSAARQDQQRITCLAKREEYWMRLDKLCIFPPGRRNLIVAILEASPAWHQLYRDLRTTAKNSSKLREVLRYTKEKFVPHITLANLEGGGRIERDQLIRLLETSCYSIMLRGKDCPCLGISMVGPVPSQIDLNWNFYI